MFLEVQANFSGTFVDFRLMIIAQERINKYVDPRPSNLQLLGVFQNAVVNVARNCWERNLNIAVIM